MIHARAHDQTVADDYFGAMQGLSSAWRLRLLPRNTSMIKLLKVQDKAALLVCLESLGKPTLPLDERLYALARLHELFGMDYSRSPDVHSHEPLDVGGSTFHAIRLPASSANSRTERL